jgi:hypothetical protein
MPPSEDFAPIATWLEAIHQAIKEHTESVAKYQQSEQSERQKQAQSELNTVVRLPVEVTEYYRAEQSERPVKNRREIIRISLEIGGVITAIILAGLTFKTLLAFKNQLSEMQIQTVTIKQQVIQSARDSQQQLELARDQVATAQDSVAAIQRQMRQDQRAWLAPISGSVTLNDKHSLRVDVILHNLGKTPALNVSTILDWRDIQPGPLDLKYSPLVKTVGHGTVYSTGKMGMFAASPQIPTIDELNAHRTGKRVFYFFGIIGYEDIFGRKHSSRLCNILNLDLATVRQCDTYNVAN